MSTKHDPRCPVCKESMQAGFLLEVSHNMNAPTHWVEGEPVKGMLGGVKVDLKKAREVVTYRCARCSVLLSFAP